MHKFKIKYNGTILPIINMHKFKIKYNGTLLPIITMHKFKIKYETILPSAINNNITQLDQFSLIVVREYGPNCMDYHGNKRKENVQALDCMVLTLV